MLGRLLANGCVALGEIRHTYCSNMAKSGMNPKTLQYLMGHSDIGVTLNTYTHFGEEDAKEEMEKMGLSDIRSKIRVC